MHDTHTEKTKMPMIYDRLRGGGRLIISILRYLSTARTTSVLDVEPMANVLKDLTVLHRIDDGYT